MFNILNVQRFYFKKFMGPTKQGLDPGATHGPRPLQLARCCFQEFSPFTGKKINKEKRKSRN